MSKIYRTEYPKPQFERQNWMNLNGEWDFEIDNEVSGKEKGYYKVDYIMSKKINVPFCPESKLSGIENKDFMRSVWYKREISITEEQLTGVVVLHFGAVDYLCTVYINGDEVGVHKGGYCSFEFDITDKLKVGKNIITINAEDDVRNPMVPRGKQSEKYASNVCDYTRTTGIWQTVWLEFKPINYIKSIKYYPDIRGYVTIETELNGAEILRIEIKYKGKVMANKSLISSGGCERIKMSLSETHLWEVGNGRLYDVELVYGDDLVKSYFGLRTVRLDDKKFLINEKSVFQRLILDQGFYPDGIYTAPDDKDLERDIDLSLAMGFNGARLHQKVFEERFLYYCDKKGYIVWGEYASWGLDHTNKNAVYSILPEWLDIIKRDFNHPSIIGWCPYNETWDLNGRAQENENIEILYEVTKAIDNSRPCIDTSGNFHVKTDIFDVHDYEQNPDVFASHYDRLSAENIITDNFSKRQCYKGEPIFVSEYGGIKWCQNEDKSAWGYGNEPKSPEEFINRFKGLTEALLNNPAMFGLCYTQLTDVEQEQNGLYTYDREPKFETEIFKNILCRKAAIED